ncbi:MAG: outer membrane lipoprotein carrier protein LolA [Bacteroidales bacterium]|nr:outer membrane lipoprotein carrier protein LolA [Bacteroidales bacterium]
MLKIKNILLTTFILLAGTAGYAQSKKSADAILKEVSEKTQSYSSIRINFTYNMDNPTAKVHESETGTLLVKDEQYRLDIAGQMVISDGVTIWTYISDVNEVQINEVEDDEGILTPTRLLTAYSTDYKSKLTGEVTRGGRVQYALELKPQTDKSFTNVELNIDKELMRIARIAIQDKNGNTFSYIVNRFDANVPVKDSDFKFNIKDYPGVEVIDMR